MIELLYFYWENVLSTSLSSSAKDLSTLEEIELNFRSMPEVILLEHSLKVARSLQRSSKLSI
jgi:hypothetical protein